MRRLAAAATVALALAVPAAASASPKLFVTAHQAAGRQVQDPQRFEAVIGYPDQCVSGVRCWTYTKGSRSKSPDWPESWYLHVGGVRVKDKTFNLFVMDPRGRGWQQHVAETCGRHCFIDGLGVASISRTSPRISWTSAQWVSRAALVVRAVVAAGKLAMPNSVGFSRAQGTALIEAAGGRGSTEGFTAANANKTLRRGRIWVTEIGDCPAKYHAFLRWHGRNDHFACYEHGTLPWDLGWLGG